MKFRQPMQGYINGKLYYVDEGGNAKLLSHTVTDVKLNKDAIKDFEVADYKIIQFVKNEERTRNDS